MSYNFNDIKRLTATVDSLSRSVYKAQFAKAVKKFPLLGLVQISKIGERDDSFTYSPSRRNWVAGDASPASCRSEPNRVETSGGQPIRSFTTLHELGYEICAFDCKDETLAKVVEEKEFAVAMGLMNVLAKRFWEGNPEMMQYGITNHPSVTRIQSPADGGTGLRLWSDKTDNQIMKELRSAMKDMLNPKVWISEAAYEASLGDAVTAPNGSTDTRIRGDVVTELLKKQRTSNFNDTIRFTDELDAHADFAGKNIAIVYDEGSVELKSSGEIWTGATYSAKTVLTNRMINTSGLVVNHYDSVKIITDI